MRGGGGSNHKPLLGLAWGVGGWASPLSSGGAAGCETRHKYRRQFRCQQQLSVPILSPYRPPPPIAGAQRASGHTGALGRRCSRPLGRSWAASCSTTKASKSGSHTSTKKSTRLRVDRDRERFGGRAGRLIAEGFEQTNKQLRKIREIAGNCLKTAGIKLRKSCIKLAQNLLELQKLL